MNKDEYEHFRAQEYLQDKAITGQQMAYAPTMNEQMKEAQSALIEQTNPDKIVESIILKLRGLKERDGKLVKVTEPKMNDKGIGNISIKLYSFINQNIILSHLEKEEVGRIAIGLGDEIVDELVQNLHEYQINKTDLDTIHDIILVNVFAALKRAQEQNEKNWLGRITLENINKGSGVKPSGDGIWSKLKL